MHETDRRREKQLEHNKKHGITPKTIQKAIADIMDGAYSVQKGGATRYAKVAEETIEYAAMSPKQLHKKIDALEAQMYEHAQNLEFEEAAAIRDKINHIRQTLFGTESV